MLKTKAGRVLRYLNKYGFNNIKLTILIMDANSNLNEIRALEQQYRDSLKPNLKVDLIASSSGYHEPMAMEMREKLREIDGTPVYLYKSEDLTLLYVFDSKQHMYNTIKIHHNTLQDCLDVGTLYLDNFFLSLDKIDETTNTNLLHLLDVI
jgi:hypothetical protein